MKKIKLQHESVNQIFTPMHSFSSCWQVVYAITMLFTYNLHGLHNLQAMKMFFSKGNSNLHVQGSKFGIQIYIFCGNHQKSWTLWSLFFKVYLGPEGRINESMVLSSSAIVYFNLKLCFDKKEKAPIEP